MHQRRSSSGAAAAAAHQRRLQRLPALLRVERVGGGGELLGGRAHALASSLLLLLQLLEGSKPGRRRLQGRPCVGCARPDLLCSWELGGRGRGPTLAPRCLGCEAGVAAGSAKAELMAAVQGEGLPRHHPQRLR